VRLEHEANTIEGRVVYSLKDYSTRFVEVGLSFDQNGRQFWRDGSPKRLGGLTSTVIRKVFSPTCGRHYAP